MFVLSEQATLPGSLLCTSIHSDRGISGSAILSLEQKGSFLALFRQSLKLLLLTLKLFLLKLELTVIGFRAIVICGLVNDKPIRNPQNEKQPEKIQCLQRRQQTETNDLRETALVLLGLPVHLKGADGGEVGQNGPQDLEIEIVSQVDPSGSEEGEIRTGYSAVDVV